MSSSTAARAAWGLWAVDFVILVVLILFGPLAAGPWSTASGGVSILAFATTGALVASRRPGNPIGWLLCLSAFAFAVLGVCGEISEYAVRERRSDLPVAQVVAWVGGWVWLLGVGPAATFLLLLFPDGRLPSPRWRPVAWLAGGSLVVTLVAIALAPGRIENTPVTNPVGVRGGEAVFGALVVFGFVLLFVSILVSCVSLVVRFRSAGREQRQQLKWIAYSLPLVVVFVAASFWVEWTQSGDTAIEVSNTLAAVGLTVVPLAIGVAMLRSRLYDIDVVIKRTLVYGSLTSMLVATYLGTVLVFRLVLSPLTGESDLAVAGSTLAVAALFRPLRARIQSEVDRRFYRARYDASRTLEGFAGRLRDELDLEALGDDLRRAVRDTMQPAHVSLWLRGPS